MDQLREKDKSKVYPITLLQNVLDKDNPKVNLDMLLHGFNMVYVNSDAYPAGTTKEQLRKTIAEKYRHKGLHLSYIYQDAMVLEYYANEETNDLEWQNSRNWKQVVNYLAMSDTEIGKIEQDMISKVEGYAWYFRGVQEDEQMFTVYMSHDANIMTSDDISGIDKKVVGSLKNKFYVAKYFDSQSAYNSGRSEYAIEGAMVAYKGTSGKYMLCGFDIATSSWVELGNIDEIRPVNILKTDENGNETISNYAGESGDLVPSVWNVAKFVSKKVPTILNPYNRSGKDVESISAFGPSSTGNQSVPTTKNVYLFVLSMINSYIYDTPSEYSDTNAASCEAVREYIERHSTIGSVEDILEDDIRNESPSNYNLVTAKQLVFFNYRHTNKLKADGYDRYNTGAFTEETKKLDNVCPTNAVVSEYVDRQIGLTEKEIERLKLSTGNTTLLARYVVRDWAKPNPTGKHQEIVYEFFRPENKDGYNKVGDITVARNEHSTGNYWFGYKEGVYQDEYFQGFILRILPAVETQILVGNTYHVCHQDKTTGKDSYANVFIRSVKSTENSTLGIPNINTGPNTFYIDVYGINYPHYTPLDSTPV